MSLTSNLIGLGPYSESIVEFLDYPKETYRSVPEGTIVTLELFGAPGSKASWEFARLLGISDPWDFTQHRVGYDNVDVDGLHRFAKEYFDLRFEDDLEAFIALSQAGFQFYFRPNG